MEGGADDACVQAQAPPDQNHLEASRDNVLEEVLEYAYENHLIRDHRLSSFSLTQLFGNLIQSTIPATTEDGFTDCRHLTALELPNPTPRGEKLSVTESAVRLVYKARRELSDQEVRALTQEVCNNGISVRDLKLELPALRTDNDRDMREFRKEMLARQDVHRRNHRLPFDPVNVAAGEGLELPAEARLEAQTFLKKLEEEKLGVTRESTKYLMSNLKAGFTEEHRKRYIMEEIKNIRYEKNSALEKLELPISPKLGQDYFVPVSDACRVPIPSDPSSSIFSDDLRAAEARLFEDVDMWDEPTSPILDKFLRNSSPLMNIEPAREHISGYKIETLLLPGLSPVKPALSGPDAFSDFIAKELDIDKEIENADFENFSSDNLEDRLEAVADTVMKSIEQEQLQAADATARVPVPIMDFSISEPEWTRLRNIAGAMFKWIQGGHEDIFNLPKWPRDMLTESKLIWMPVGSGANSVSITEKIEASEALIQSFIAAQDEDDIPSSSDFVQRRNLLKVLARGDEEEDIEPLLTRVKPRTDLVKMVKKRVLDTANSASKRQRLAAKEPLANQTSGDSPTEDVPTGKHRNGGRRERQGLLQGDSPRTSARLLENFMELRTSKLTASKYFPSKVAKKDKVPTLPSPPESSERNRGSTVEVTTPSKPATRAPYPSINLPPTPFTVFISLSIDRHLIRALNRLVPNLSLIERDYCAYNTSIWSPGSVCRAEMVPPLAYDADITVSPTTGLIVTSMILIRQRPRPGLSKSSLQERIEKVSSRYERVVILVGGGGGEDDTLREISASDSMALTELQGFASGLACNAIVHYIGGGDDTLSRWVSSLVCRYAQVDHPQVQKGLLEAETLWELFLRRAGFNVYAAQALAGQLKVPSPENDNTSSAPHGLTAFVTMTRAERKQRFGPLVGLRVLERVSQMVDEIWNKG